MKARAFWPLLLLACLLTATTVAGIKLWPRIAPPSEVSDLYLHYESNPHLNVAFINDFQVNDSISVDVTTLQALDSSGWETLKKDFHIVDLSPKALEMIAQSNCSIGVRLTPKNDIGAPCDTTNSDNNYVFALDYINHTVGIFYTKNEKEIDAVMHYNYNQTDKQRKNSLNSLNSPTRKKQFAVEMLKIYPFCHILQKKVLLYI